MFDTRYMKNPDIVFRKIGHEQLLVPIRRTAGEIDGIYTLNEVAGRVWSLIDGEKIVAQIVDIIVAEFDVDFKVAEADILELLKKFISAKAIIEA